MRARFFSARDEHDRFLPRESRVYRRLLGARPEDDLHTPVSIAPLAREKKRVDLTIHAVTLALSAGGPNSRAHTQGLWHATVSR